MPLNFVAKAVITGVMMAGQMAMTAMQKIEGPRLKDLDVTTADYGTPIPRFWGSRRFEGVPIIWAEKLREKKVQSKTKGGKYQNYKYYGTWAVLITDTEIDAVSRIWFDKQLVYDATGPGPVSPAAAVVEALQDQLGGNGRVVKLSEGRNMRIYLGSEDQLPDPRMETWCEKRYGPDSCPAYRGSAYIVFENIPLEKLGNRIPQISVEAVRVKAPSYPSEVFDAATSQGEGLWGFSFSPDHSRFMYGGWGDYAIYDTATRKPLLTSSFPGPVDSFQRAFGLSNSGDVFAVGPGESGDVYPQGRLRRFTADAFGTRGSTLLQRAGEFCQVLADGEGMEWVCVVPLSFHQALQFMRVDFGGMAYSDPGFAPTQYLADKDGNLWAIGAQQGSSTIHFLCFVGDRAGESHVVASPGGTLGARLGVHNGQGSFVVAHNDFLLLIDDQTFELRSSRSATIDAYNGANQFLGLLPGAETIWLGKEEISLADLSTVRRVDYLDWQTGLIPEGVIYDPVNHALIVFDQGKIGWLYLDRVGNGGVTLGAIINEVSGWVGVPDADTSLCTQPIKGYSVTQGPAKDMLAPLLDAYDVDAHPHDFLVKFTPRGAAPVLSIDVGDFARGGESPRYVTSRAQDTDLPLHINFNYADGTKDQQTNTAIAKREALATDSRRELSIDLTTLVLEPNEAQPLVERFMRRRWNERDGVTLSLTAMQLGVEPSQVATLHLDRVSWNARLTKMVVKRSLIDTEWTRDAVALATLPNTAGATMDGRDDEVIFIPGPAKGFVLDVPLVRDADADINPLLYFAAGGYGGTSFPGADVWRGDDGTYDEQWGGIDSDQAATWGYVSEALPDCIPWLWDRGSTLTLNLVSGGTLNTVTEAEIDADPTLNLVAIGATGRYEFVQFTTATLVSGNTWTISGFKRGRRGTEGNCGNHVAGDELIFLNQARHVEMGVSNLGDALSFKVAATGRSVVGSPAIDVTYSGATLKPRAPVVAWKVKEANGDITIHLRSRTRIGGNWNGSTIPTGETIESYQFDVMDGDAVKRIISSGSKTLTYTLAQQIDDGGEVLPQVLDGNAYQLSATVGRGFAQAA